MVNSGSEIRVDARSIVEVRSVLRTHVSNNPLQGGCMRVRGNIVLSLLIWCGCMLVLLVDDSLA